MDTFGVEISFDNKIFNGILTQMGSFCLPINNENSLFAICVRMFTTIACVCGYLNISQLPKIQFKFQKRI